MEMTECMLTPEEKKPQNFSGYEKFQQDNMSTVFLRHSCLELALCFFCCQMLTYLMYVWYF